MRYRFFSTTGLFCTGADEEWIAAQTSIAAAGRDLIQGKPCYATIAVSSRVLEREEEVEILLTSAEEWDVDGYYLVAEHPNGLYIVDDPNWLANLLDLCTGLKRHRRTVIVGYSSHQQLILAAANVDAIASGTWQNVRSFSTGRFQSPRDRNDLRRSTWYYSPHALSEYQIQFLDIARRANKLDILKHDEAIGSTPADVLFSGVQPSSADFREPHAFQHYLHCLRYQVQRAKRSSYDETFESQMLGFETAEACIQEAKSYGVFGGRRDFSDAIDAGRSALALHNHLHSFTLTMEWA